VTAGLAVMLAAIAAALVMGPPAGVSRLRRLSLPTGDQTGELLAAAQPRAAQDAILASTAARAGCAAFIGIVACWVVGGMAGALCGLGLGLMSWLALRRLESTAEARAAASRAQAVPLVAELLSTAVAAGSPPVVAAEVVAEALGGPMGQALRSAATSARLGTDPASGWSKLASDPALRPLARALASSVSRGTSPVSVLDRLAHDARDTARWAAEARARSLGARAAAPLGLCFLPAFVLVGIVPVVATAGRLLP
jgi:Flp pilus assembly protein TadB